MARDINSEKFPFILLDEARKYCHVVAKNGKYVSFAFNEKIESKEIYLEKSIIDFVDKCTNENCKRKNCVYHFDFRQEEFRLGIQIFQGHKQGMDRLRGCEG